MASPNAVEFAVSALLLPLSCHLNFAEHTIFFGLVTISLESSLDSLSQVLVGMLSMLVATVKSQLSNAAFIVL